MERREQESDGKKGVLMTKSYSRNKER